MYNNISGKMTIIVGSLGQQGSYTFLTEFSQWLRYPASNYCRFEHIFLTASRLIILSKKTEAELLSTNTKKK